MAALTLILVIVVVVLQCATIVFMKTTAWHNEQIAMWNASTEDYRQGDFKTGDMVASQAKARAANPPWYVRLSGLRP